MKSPSLLERLRPALATERTIDWPGPVPEGMERPRILLRVLNVHALEDAYLAAQLHFRAKKVRIAADDPIFTLRERDEQVWRAVRDASGAPLAETTDQMLDVVPRTLSDLLFQEWVSLQAECSAGPLGDAQLVEVVEGLKKNFPGEMLAGWPSTWLLRLLRILVDQSSTSPSSSSSGS